MNVKKKKSNIAKRKNGRKAGINSEKVIGKNSKKY